MDAVVFKICETPLKKRERNSEFVPINNKFDGFFFWVGIQRYNYNLETVSRSNMGVYNEEKKIHL